MRTAIIRVAGIAIGAALALSGCASQLAQNNCTQMGYEIGTPAYADCFRSERAEIRDRMLSISDSLGSMSAVLLNEANRRQSETNALNASIYRGGSPSLTCNPTGWGNGSLTCQ
jgi:hypothetical protein